MKRSRRRSYSKKKCPRGSISRLSYSYRKKSLGGKKIKVRASCIKSRGLRSRGKRTRRVLPLLKKGSLTKFGYTVHESADTRRKALHKALKEYGYSSLIKKLNAVRLLTRNTSPGNSKIYDSDIKYLQNLSPKKSKRKTKKRRS